MQAKPTRYFLWVCPVLVGALIIAAIPAQAQFSPPVGTLQVYVTNLSTQIMSPVVIASHGDDTRVFQAGQAASDPVRMVAEDAINGPLVDALENDPEVLDVQVITGDAGPIMPGETAMAEITSVGKYDYISAVSMLVTTNDAFTGLDSFRAQRFGVRETYANAYDAGTEANTENCDHIPGPPCGNAEVRVTDGAEGVILIHRGIRGDGDVPIGVDWRNPVAKFRFERVRGR